MPFVDEAGSPAVQPQALTPAVIRNRLVERGWSQRAATGAAANFAHEAGGGADAPLNPGAIGDNGNAIGLPQWNGPRKRAYEEFAQSRGKDWRDVETQLDYLDAEMGRDFKGLRDRMDAAGSDEDAARLFVKEFERPADLDTNLRVRGETARKLSAAQLAAVGPVGAIAERLRGLAEPAFRTQNTVGSAITRLTEEGGPAYIDRDFDPIGEALADPDLADHAESFIDVRNREHFQTRANIIRRENENRRLLDEGGAWGVGAQVLAGVIDPVNLLPVGGGAWRASRAANVALGAGRVGVGSALGAAASELALQATQETRTAEESAMTIGTSFVLGGVLGGLAGAMAPREFAAAGRAVDRATVPEATAVYDDVRSQLLAAGRGEAEAHAGAGLWKAHVEAMAGITGHAPDKIYRDIGFSVRSGEPPSGMSSGFKPTHDWQEVPSDAVLPPGLEIRMDMESGRNMARVPPGQPLPAGVEETFAQSLSDMNPGMRDVVQQAMDVSDATGRQSWVWRNPDGTYAHELNGKPPVAGATLEGRVFGSAGASETGGEVLFQAAYHGSPHRFDKFSLDAIGTGEGAQAYGWGLYFAENKGVAESYRATLSRGQVAGWRVNGGLFGRDKIVDEKTLSPLTRQIIGEHDNLQDAIDVLSLYSNNADMSKDINTLRNIIKKKGSRIERGQLYKVDVPESDVLLDWDAPLVKQNEGVIEKLRESGLFAKAEEVSDIVDETTGEDLYKYLSVALGDDKSASLALRDAGIPGLKYFDGASRRSGDGSRNFVVFDDAAVKTLETFYQSGASDLRMEKNKTVEEFLNSLPDDFSKFHIDDAGLSKAESALLNALKDDDWLAYDSPRKAVEIALSDRLEDFAPSGEVRSAVKQYKADTQPAAAKSSERDVTETKEFKNWFGKSKVVDEYGRPLVVSHGSRAENISEFENNGRTAYGIFFTDAPETAKYYAGQHGKIYNVFLKAERPADLRNDRTLRKVVREAGLTNEYKDIKAAIDDGELYQNFAGRSTQDRIIKAAQRLGHDAVILPDYTPSVGVTNSYIVFSPEQIKSVDNAGSFSSLSKSMFNQDARGAVELGDGIARITLGAKADASTFLHESGHVFLHTLDRLAKDSPELADDLAKVREWLGNGGGRFTVEQQEKWARGFEAYLREGKAPAPALQRIFDQFREWLAAIYRNLSDLDVELSDDVRGVMDRLLGIDEDAPHAFREPRDLSSAALPPVEGPDDLKLARGAELPAGLLARTPLLRSPDLVLATSPVKASRRAMRKLMRPILATEGDMAGRGAAENVEASAAQWDGRRVVASMKTRRAFVDYKAAAKAAGERALSYDEFKSAVAVAGQEGDDAKNLGLGTEAQKAVTQVAKAWRSEVLDPLLKSGIEVGVMKQSQVDRAKRFAKSYMPRDWNLPKIKEQRNRFTSEVVMPQVYEDWEDAKRLATAAAQKSRFADEQLRQAISAAEEHGGPEATALVAEGGRNPRRVIADTIKVLEDAYNDPSVTWHDDDMEKAQALIAKSRTPEWARSGMEGVRKGGPALTDTEAQELQDITLRTLGMLPSDDADLGAKALRAVAALRSQADALAAAARNAGEQASPFATPGADEVALRRKIAEEEGRLRGVNKSLGAINSAIDRLTKRKALFTRSPSERTPEDMARMLNAMRTGRGMPKEPASLMAWLRKNGGLQDQGGELTAYVGDRRGLVGLLNDKSGMTLDDATLRAWEAGYIGIGEDRPSPDALMDAVRRELGGEKVYAIDDLDAEYELQAFRDLDQALTEAGVDLKKMTNDEAMAAMSGEKAPRLSPERAREIGVQETSLNKAQKRMTRLRDKADERAAKLLAKAEELRARREGMDAEARSAIDQQVAKLSEDAEKAAAIARDYGVAVKKSLAQRANAARFMDGETRALAALDEEQLPDVAHDIVSAFLSHDNNRIQYGSLTIGQRGPMKEKTFNVRDERVREWVNLDIDDLMQKHVRTMAADIEMKRITGDVNGDTLRNEIIRDYDERARAMEDGPAKTRLDKRMRADLDAFDGAVARQRGLFSIPRNQGEAYLLRGVRLLKSWNFMRLMGGGPLGQMEDIGRIIYFSGIKRFLGDAIVPMVNNWKAIKLTGEELRLADIATEVHQASMAIRGAEIFDDYAPTSAVERTAQGAAQVTSKMFLLDRWNRSIKTIGGMIAQAKMAEALKALAAGELDGMARADLSRAGIGQREARILQGFVDEFGTNIKGVIIPNTQDWRGEGAEAAVRLWRSALRQGVDDMVINPGQDKQLWLSRPLGSALGQLETFNLVSTQRTLLVGLQRRDSAVVVGAAAMVGASMFGMWLKSELFGWELPDWETMLARSVVRQAGVLSSVHDRMARASGGAISVDSMMGSPSRSRYADYGVGSFLGPSGDLAETLVRSTQAAGTGTWNRRNTRNVRQTMALQNWAPVRRIWDEAEREFNDMIGVRNLPPRQ